MDDPLSLLAFAVWTLAAGMYPLGFMFGVCSACCDPCGFLLPFERCVRVETPGGEYAGGHCPVFLASPGGGTEAPYVEGNGLRVVNSPSQIRIPVLISLSASGGSRTPVGTTRTQTWRILQATVSNPALYDVVGPPWHLQVDLEVTGVATAGEAGVTSEYDVDEYGQPKLILLVNQFTSTITHTEQVTLFPIGLQRDQGTTFRLTASTKSATLVGGDSVSGWSVSKAAGITIDQRSLTLRFSEFGFYCRELYGIGGNRFIFDSETAVAFLNGEQVISLPISRLSATFTGYFQVFPANLLCDVPATALSTGIALDIYPAQVSATASNALIEELDGYICNTLALVYGWAGGEQWGNKYALPGDNALYAQVGGFYDGFSLLWSLEEGPARTSYTEADGDIEDAFTFNLFSGTGSVRPRDTISTAVFADCWGVKVIGTFDLLDDGNEWEMIPSVDNQITSESPFASAGTGLDLCNGDYYARGGTGSPYVLGPYGQETRQIVVAGIFRRQMGEFLTTASDYWVMECTAVGGGSFSNYCNNGTVTVSLQSPTFRKWGWAVEGNFAVFPRDKGFIEVNASVEPVLDYDIVQEPLPPVPSCSAWSPSVGQPGGVLTRTCSDTGTESWSVSANTSRFPRYRFLEDTSILPRTASGIIQPGSCVLRGLRNMQGTGAIINNPFRISSVPAGTCLYFAPGFGGTSGTVYTSFPCDGCTTEIELLDGAENATVRLLTSGPKAGLIEIIARRTWLGAQGVIIAVTCGTDTITQVILRSDTAPTPPRNLFVERDPCSTAVLTWDAPEWNGGQPLTRYNVQYRLFGAASYTTFGTVGPGVLTATITGLAETRGYQFRVTATNSVGTSDSSNVVDEKFFDVLEPTGLTADRSDCDKAVLNWTAPQQTDCQFVTEYRVEYRSLANANYALAGTVAGNVTTATVTGLDDDVTYRFRIGRVSGGPVEVRYSTFVEAAGCPQDE